MAAPASPSPPRVVLASASPRRRDLLWAAGVHFETIPANIPEERNPEERPRDFALRLAREKALAIADELPSSSQRWVLGADTIVVLGDRILGKPRDPGHAEEILGELAGRTHEVITAVAIAAAGGGIDAETAVTTRVRFRSATPAEIHAYVATRESLDKAGAYAFQGEGRRFVAHVEGSETNVIGLPVEETLALLERVTGLEVPK